MPLTNDYGAACFLEMGTGKSKIAVDTANLIYQNSGKPIKVLAIGPDKAVGVWTREFRIHSKEDAKVVPLVKLTRKGTRASSTPVAFKANLAQSVIDRAEEENAVPISVVATNYESCWRAPLDEVLVGTTWDLLIVDESHRVQNPSARSSSFILELARCSQRRMILTGTEIGSSGVAGVFSQIGLIDSAVFGESYEAFLSRYTRRDRRGGVVGVRNQEDLSERIEGVTYRASADVLDLPELTHVFRYVDLSPEAARAYIGLSEEAILEEGGGLVTVENHLALKCRLQQICGGFIGGLDTGGSSDDDLDSGVDNVSATYRFPNSGKAQELLDILGDIPTSEPVVVFCRYKEELKQIAEVAKATGRTYGEISGARSDGLTGDATMNPEVQLLGAQIQAAGAGVDLTLAHTGIYWSKDFSVHNYRQSIARLHRNGQERNTLFIHLITSPVGKVGSVDLDVEQALTAGMNLADWFIDKGLSRNIDYAAVQEEIEQR